MNQSLWDNFLALVFLAPFLMLICGPVIGFEHGIRVMEVLGDIKLGESFTMAEVLAYIWIGIAIVYFGLRGMAERLITSIFSKGKALVARKPAESDTSAVPSPLLRLAGAGWKVRRRTVTRTSRMPSTRMTENKEVADETD